MSNQSSQDNNKRIAKNTLLLYFRLFLTMGVSLFTSRVVLDVLGVENYGIYNVVGGVVVMFSLFTGSLSAAISRFLTYELGRGDKEKLSLVFSTSVNIQVVLAIIVTIIAELVGVWFLNNQLNIPEGRMEAANWVLQFSILTFAVNLISVPYNSAIIAHEKMSAFAYISIVEVVLKLLVAYLLYISPIDNLVTYGMLLAAVAILIRCIYSIYCNRHFEECHYRMVYDKSILKQMTGFAGWNFLGSAATILNNQGINIIINIFFGVAVNAARGVTNQIEGIVKQFVSNFTTAINPQITKSYASGDYEYMNKLVINGAKYSIYLMLIFIVPLLFEIETILSLWLGQYPDYTPIFLRLSLIGSLIDLSGNSLAIAVWASGRIKKYYIIIGPMGLMSIPISYFLFKMGLPAYFSYLAYIVTYSCIQIVRLFVAKSEIPFQIKPYIKSVYIRPFLVAAVSISVTCIPYYFFEDGLLKDISIVFLSIIFCLISVYIIGLTKNERLFVNSKIRQLLKH